MRNPDSCTKHDLPTERSVERKYNQRIQAGGDQLDAGGRIAGALRNILNSKYIRIFG